MPGTITEIDVVKALEGFRRATNALLDISFETIAGTGANGAVMHYRVTETTNARLEDGQLIVVDSGGQYIDGTTDITRTLPIGLPGDEERRAFTRVLKGMIAIFRGFPKGAPPAVISTRWHAIRCGWQDRISTMAPAMVSGSISACTRGLRDSRGSVT